MSFWNIKNKGLMADIENRRNARADRLHEHKMAQIAHTENVAMPRHQMADATARRQQDTWRDIGMAEVGIKQQDIDLDKTAWDFTQQRYAEFGRPADRNHLLRDKIATMGNALTDGFDMDPEKQKEFLGRFSHLFFGEDDDSGVGGDDPVASPSVSDIFNPTAYLRPKDLLRFSDVSKIFGGHTAPTMPMPNDLIISQSNRRPGITGYLEERFPRARGHRGKNTPSWW